VKCFTQADFRDVARSSAELGYLIQGAAVVLAAYWGTSEARARARSPQP